MTLKNLWAHRGKNGFIFVEIILAAVLSFFALDAIVVVTYNTHIARASGEFEKEHLLVGEVSPLPTSPDGEGTRSDTLGVWGLYALRDHVQSLPEVQSVSLANEVFGGRYQESSWDSVRTETGTQALLAYEHSFLRGEHFFETRGLTSVEGSPSVEELSEAKEEYGVVITRSLAQALFGTEKAVGRRIVYGGKYHFEENNRKHLIVCGVVEDVKAIENQRYFYSIFYPSDLWDNSPSMLIRLKPDADAEAFLARYDMPDMRLQEGTYRLTETETFKDYLKHHNRLSEGHMLFTVFSIFLSILLVGVVLGTLGTYWLQIRGRMEDIGIMRSFGAKRRDIFRMIWQEAALLTFVACVIGQIIWLQFAMNDLLFMGEKHGALERETDWVAQFWPHFFTVCGVQLLLMLLVVTLGITIPTLIAMYTKPVEALRHE